MIQIQPGRRADRSISRPLVGQIPFFLPREGGPACGSPYHAVPCPALPCPSPYPSRRRRQKRWRERKKGRKGKEDPDITYVVCTASPVFTYSHIAHVARSSPAMGLSPYPGSSERGWRPRRPVSQLVSQSVRASFPKAPDLARPTGQPKPRPIP